MPRWFLTLPLLLLPVVTAAATLVVATSGSDSAPCTAAAPCRTIGHALSRMQSGDTLTMQGGSYDENNLRPPSDSTVQGAPGETVIIRPTGSAAPGFELPQNASHITIRNLKIDGSGGGISYGLLIYTSDCLIEHVEVAHVQNQGIALYRDPHFTSQRCTLRNDHVHGSGRAGCHGITAQDGYCHGVYVYTNDNVIEGGEYDHNNGWGMQTYGANLTVEQAFVHDNEAGGITIPGSAQVVNSVFTYNNPDGQNAVIWAGSNSTFRDLTIKDNPSIGLYLPSGTSNVTVANVLSTGNHPNLLNDMGLSVRIDGSGAQLVSGPTP